MITTQDINDLRKIAMSILDWVTGLIDAIGVNEYWGCQGNDEAISSEVREELKEMRGRIEAEDIELFLALGEFTRRVAKQVDKQAEYVEGVLNRELDDFVIRCAQHPGPEANYDWGKPELKWDIEFSEAGFNEMVRNISKLLSLRFVDEGVLVRAECRGLKFKGDVTLSDALYYEEDSSQFVLRFGNDASIRDVSNESLRVFNALEVTLRLVYGFDAGLGRIIAIYPYSRGGERPVIREPRFVFTDHTRCPSHEALRNIWDQSLQALNQANRHISLLIAKVLALGQSYDAQLLDLMTCYEMILADGVEIRYKLSIRGATLLDRLGVGGSYDTIWKAYKDRSDSIHGNDAFDEEDRRRITEANSKLSLWLRLLTLVFLLYNGGRESFLVSVDQLVRASISPPREGNVGPLVSRLEEAIRTVNALGLLGAADETQRERIASSHA